MKVKKYKYFNLKTKFSDCYFNMRRLPSVHHPSNHFHFRTTIQTYKTPSNMHLRVFPILLVLALLGPAVSRAGSYQQSKSIHDALLSSATYNPTQRPLRDQDDVLDVYAFFEVVSIVEINDVVQSFKCNGFLGLVWRDEVRLSLRH